MHGWYYTGMIPFFEELVLFLHVRSIDYSAVWYTASTS